MQNVAYPGGPDSSGQSQFEISMPQPTYDNGFPQPIRQPMPGSSTMAGVATSKALKTGISSILWMLFGWIIVIGPLFAIIQGIRAVIKGIGELIRAHYTEGFGRGAAVVGILLGLIGGGIPSVCSFMIGRVAYIAFQAEMNGQEIILDEDEDSWNLLVHGKARLRDKDAYDGEQANGAANAPMEDSSTGSDATSYSNFPDVPEISSPEYPTQYSQEQTPQG